MDQITYILYIPPKNECGKGTTGAHHGSSNNQHGTTGGSSAPAVVRYKTSQDAT